LEIWNPKKDIRDQWYELLKTFTHRKLTVSGDRLPAISGLAAYFSKALNDEYKAGLWKSKLPFELLWTLDDPDHLEKEPSQYQGPSWSWAAVNQRIRFFQKSFYADDCFEVVDCQTKTQSRGLKAMTNNSQFGPVESGSLTLKGRLQTASWKLPGAGNIDWSFRGNSIVTNQINPNYRQYRALYRSHNNDWKDQLTGDTMYLDALFNDLTADKFPISVHLMIVGRTFVPEKTDPTLSRRIVGVVLKMKSATEYTRLGIFDFALEISRRDDLDWLETGEVQTVTIV
jgi:hypothetical protein